MKVVLTRPNYESHLITPPIGLGYLSSYLQQESINTKIIDGLRTNTPNQKLAQQIIAEKPDAVGITCMTAHYHQTIELSKMLKERGMKVVIGGIHPTFLPEQTLKDSQADYIIRGEGEKALLKLAQNNFTNRGIKGVYDKRNIKEQPKTKADPITELDNIPFPDWRQIDPNTYPKAPHGAIVKNFPIGIIITTRGCPYECTFCAGSKFYDRTIRYRTPQNVIKEITYLTTQFGVQEIHFEDDNLTLNKKHITQICQLIIQRNIKISWACPNGIRADTINTKLLKLMKKSGCYYIAYGIESANPQILKNVKKHETITQITKAINKTHKTGITTQGFFVLGLPGENKKTLKQTINYATNSKLDRAQFIILDILPGSQLWNDLQGKFTPNWHKKSYKEPEWIPQGLTKKGLMEAQSNAFKKFYLKPKRMISLIKNVRPKQIPYLTQRLLEYRILKDAATQTIFGTILFLLIIFPFTQTSTYEVKMINLPPEIIAITTIIISAAVLIILYKIYPPHTLKK